MVNRERRTNIGESLDNGSNVIERRRNKTNNQIESIGKYVKTSVQSILSMFRAPSVILLVFTSYYFYASMVNTIQTTTSTFVPESYPVSVEIFPFKFDELSDLTLTKNRTK